VDKFEHCSSNNYYKDFDMRWIESNGGPIIMVPQAALADWSGFRVKPMSNKSDYDHACEIEDYLGTLVSGDATILVFGDEPLRTTFISNATEKLFVRWVYAESEQSILDRVNQLPPIHGKADLRLALEGQYTLFDAAEPGNSIMGDSLLLQFDPGLYDLYTVKDASTKNVSILLHRLLKVA
jgi:Immunity protein 21